jgi:hypothetical protein
MGQGMGKISFLYFWSMIDYGKLQCVGTMDVGPNMPLHTPFFSYYFSAPANTKVDPPAEINAVADPGSNATAQLLASVPARKTPASVNEPSMGSSLDLNTMLAMQLLSMGQMQMQMFQNMFGTSASMLNGMKSLPQPSNTITNALASSQATGFTAIDSRKTYPKVKDFFSQIIGRDPDWDIQLMMDKLIEGGVFRIDEILWFREDDLKETYGLHVAEAKWLLREVNKAVAAENAANLHGL